LIPQTFIFIKTRKKSVVFSEIKRIRARDTIVKMNYIRAEVRLFVAISNGVIRLGEKKLWLLFCVFINLPGKRGLYKLSIWIIFKVQV
jgi:hypothetical protein